MLLVASEHDFGTVEPALRRAAERHEASVLNVTHVGRQLHESNPGEDASVFCICAPELYTALLAADIRMSAFLPCRIAAYTEGGGAVLETVSPLHFCRLLNRPDLAPLVLPLENLLRAIMEDAGKPLAASSRAALAEHHGGLGATEEQMNARGAIPQRIDCHGTKVEELGGTGEHDAQGG
jgi:uncharacterized protein (DUF302 family)